MRKIPHCPGVTPGEIHKICAEITPRQLSRWYDLNTTVCKQYLSGEVPIPYMLYELLAFRRSIRLPSTAGCFANWRIFNGERLAPPDGKGGLCWEEIDMLSEYRRNADLVVRQADLIESLSKREAFYRQQCALEAKHGLWIRDLFSSSND